MRYLKYLLIIPQLIIAFVGISLQIISSLLRYTSMAIEYGLDYLSYAYIDIAYWIDDIRSDK